MCLLHEAFDALEQHRILPSQPVARRLRCRKRQRITGAGTTTTGAIALAAGAAAAAAAGRSSSSGGVSEPRQTVGSDGGARGLNHGLPGEPFGALRLPDAFAPPQRLDLMRGSERRAVEKR